MKGLVSCDWLALSCFLGRPDPIAHYPKGWRLEPQSGTSVWGVREYLFDDHGAKVATYLRAPKSAIMDCRRMVIEVANEWLYNSLILNKLEIILELYPCVVTGMPRFDLCFDAELDEHAEEVMLKLVSGDIYKTSTQQGVVWFTKRKRDMYPHQISWGAPESTFHWKLYNKYKEIYKEGYCAKPYIVEKWEALGMRKTKVWRLECSVSDSPKLKVRDGEVVRKLTWHDVVECRTSLYLDLYNNKFVLRKNEGHSNKSRDSREWLWGLEKMQKLVGYEERLGESTTDSERRLLRKLYQEYMKVDKSEVVVGVLEDSIGKMLQKPKLESIFKEMSGMTAREVHMRFPKSLEVPADRRNMLQFSMNFGAPSPQMTVPQVVQYFEGSGPYPQLIEPMVIYPNGCEPHIDKDTFVSSQRQLSIVNE